MYGLRHGSDDKTQKDWVTGIAGKCQKGHDKHREGCVLECDPKKSLVSKACIRIYGCLRICSCNTGIFFHGDLHGV